MEVLVLVRLVLLIGFWINVYIRIALKNGFDFY